MNYRKAKPKLKIVAPSGRELHYDLALSNERNIEITNDQI